MLGGRLGTLVGDCGSPLSSRRRTSGGKSFGVGCRCPTGACGTVDLPSVGGDDVDGGRLCGREGSFCARTSRPGTAPAIKARTIRIIGRIVPAPTHFKLM